MNIIFLLLFMLFCHVFDDYFLQGCLANLKQKKWWEKNAPDDKYKYDYLMALGCHAFSWTFSIMLPLAINSGFNLNWFFLAYPINFIIHYVTDDLKANRGKINLIADQSIHFAQIIITWVVYCCLFIWR